MQGFATRTIIIIEGPGVSLLAAQRMLEMIHAQESIQMIEMIDAHMSGKTAISTDPLQRLIEGTGTARLETSIFPMHRERRKAQWKQESNDRYIRRHR